MRTLLYKSITDCTAQWGWGFDDVNVGSGGAVWLYDDPSAARANGVTAPVKFCYRYASSPMRTLIYMGDDCSQRWGWTYTDPNLNSSGGEFWAPKGT
jgi:hypothetical protein